MCASWSKNEKPSFRGKSSSQFHKKPIFEAVHVLILQCQINIMIWYYAFSTHFFSDFRKKERDVSIFSVKYQNTPIIPVISVYKVYQMHQSVQQRIFLSKLLHSNFVSVSNIFGSLCAQNNLNKWKPNNLTRKLMKYQIFFVVGIFYGIFGPDWV